MRLGVVGTGHWARSVHARAIADHPHHELVGVWGRSESRRRGLADDLGATAFDSFAAMVVAVDAVSFATDPQQQSELAVQAVDANKHLVLDKPAALTSHQVSSLTRACEARGLTAKVFHTARYRPEIEQWIRQTAGHTWTSGVGRWLAAALSDASSPYLDSQWRKERGPLWDAGPHAVSILLPIFGPIKAARDSHWDGPTLTTQLVFETADVRVDLSVAEPSGISSIELVIEGPSGQMRMPDIATPGPAAYGLLLDRFAGDGDVSDLVLGERVVAALQLIERSLDDDRAFNRTGRR